jgi:hypothetical protein
MYMNITADTVQSIRTVYHWVTNFFVLALGGLAAGFWWIYRAVVSNPIEAIYYAAGMGIGWGNRPKPKICAMLMPDTNMEFWNATAANRAECERILNEHLESFNADILCVIYFAVLTFIVLQVLRNCWMVFNPFRVWRHRD